MYDTSYKSKCIKPYALKSYPDTKERRVYDAYRSLFSSKSEALNTNFIIEESDLVFYDSWNTVVFCDRKRVITVQGRHSKFTIPAYIPELKDEILHSEYILDLEYDFDDQESPKYEIDTWRKSIKFLIDYLSWVVERYSTSPKIPKIYNGPKGSIDILWEDSRSRMLINIDAEGKLAQFYADKNNSQSTEGQFYLSEYIDYNFLPVIFEAQST